jgi:hypothetical protein
MQRLCIYYDYLDSGIRRNDGVTAIYLPNFETAFLPRFSCFILLFCYSVILYISICLFHMRPQLRHSGMFLAGIQVISQLDLANHIPGLLNNYLYRNVLKRLDEHMSDRRNLSANPFAPTQLPLFEILTSPFPVSPIPRFSVSLQSSLLFDSFPLSLF